MEAKSAVALVQENHFEEHAQLFRDIRAEIAKVIIGQEEMIDLMVFTLLSKGHILLEGVPGLAKSLAVETFAKVIGGNFKRFQFTPDKMPSDITGTMVYNERERKFDYYFGPIFCNIFLADEINRASPKVQSALLQAMQEKKVDVECLRYDIPNPFMVLATQNPIEQIGTYPLAEAQVDRFMVKYGVGYPNKEEEIELIERKNTNFEELKADLKTIATTNDILAMQKLIHEKVRVTKKVMDYIINICITTRPPETYQGEQLENEIYKYIRLGASPRATESLLALAKSFAFCHGRDFVNFDDVNKCAVHILRHRILLNSNAIAKQITSDMIVNEIIKMVNPY
ncbi:MAG: MoxR family ATPase [Pseudomonadota bacterium]